MSIQPGRLKYRSPTTGDLYPGSSADCAAQGVSLLRRYLLSSSSAETYIEVAHFRIRGVQLVALRPLMGIFYDGIFHWIGAPADDAAIIVSSQPRYDRGTTHPTRYSIPISDAKFVCLIRTSTNFRDSYKNSAVPATQLGGDPYAESSIVKPKE